MKYSLKKILSLLLIVILICFFFFYGKNVSYKDQLYLFDSVRNTSGAIFTIMGIWIAVIYPNSLKIFSEEITNNEEEKQIEKIRKLIIPMIYSSTIFSIVLIIQIFYPIAKQISIFNSNITIFRGLLYSLLGTLNILQIWTLFLALIPGTNLLRDFRHISKTRTYRNKFHSRNSRR